MSTTAVKRCNPAPRGGKSRRRCGKSRADVASPGEDVASPGADVASPGADLGRGRRSQFRSRTFGQPPCRRVVHNGMLWRTSASDVVADRCRRRSCASRRMAAVRR
jgi:hypothetical protein